MANDHDDYEEPVHLCVLWAIRAHQYRCRSLQGQQPLIADYLARFVDRVNRYPELRALDPTRAYQAVDALMQYWFIQESPQSIDNSTTDRWGHLMYTTRDEARRAFAQFWEVWPSTDDREDDQDDDRDEKKAAQNEKANDQPPARQKGSSPLAEALERADTIPLELPYDVTFRRTEGYQRFISLAGWLQVLRGAKPIILPTDPLGELLGVAPGRISLWRSNAVEDGYLHLVREADHDRRRATQFVFVVNQCWQLRSAASPAVLAMAERYS